MDPTLTSVEITGHLLVYMSGRFLAPMRGLQTLVLRGIGLGAVQDFAFALLPNLRHLDLSDNNLPAGIRFSQLPTFNKLEVLNLYNASRDQATMYARPFAVKSAMSRMCGQPTPPKILTQTGEPLCEAKRVLSSSNETCWRQECVSPDWTPKLIPCPGASGETLLETSICDGFVDCSDGSDETPSLCSWDIDYIGSESKSTECNELFANCIATRVGIARSNGILRLSQDVALAGESCTLFYQSPTFQNIVFVPNEEGGYFYTYEGAADQLGYNFTLKEAETSSGQGQGSTDVLVSFDATFGLVCTYRFASPSPLSLRLIRQPPASEDNNTAIGAAVGGATAAIFVAALIILVVFKRRRNKIRGEHAEKV